MSMKGFLISCASCGSSDGGSLAAGLQGRGCASGVDILEVIPGKCAICMWDDAIRE